MNPTVAHLPRGAIAARWRWGGEGVASGKLGPNKHAVDVDDLDPWASRLLPRSPFELIDGLPPFEVDRFRPSFSQEIQQRSTAARWSCESPVRVVVEKTRDRFDRAVLVRADDAGRATFDPPGHVHTRPSFSCIRIHN